MRFSFFTTVYCLITYVKCTTTIALKDVSFQADQQNLIYTLNTPRRIKCFFMCHTISRCFIVKFIANSLLCKLYSVSATFSLVDSNDSTLYRKYGDNQNGIIYEGLTNYWPFNGDLNDYVGSAHLTIGSNADFDKDRFLNSRSSINVNNGYLQAPQGVYFKGDFTVTAWVKINQMLAWSRLLDFGFSIYYDVIQISLLDWSNNVASVSFTTQDFNQTLFTGTKSLGLGQWSHLAMTLTNSNAEFYVNGTSAGSYANFKIPRDVVRQNCYFGKSYDYQNPLACANFDEIKIYNRALSQNEIQYDMNLQN